MSEDILTNILIFKNQLWMEDYAFRMEKWFNGEEIGPMRIDAELHRRCNLNCRMCARRASPIDLTEESKRIEMNSKRWVEIVRESGEFNTRAWNISGLGEPMCKPQTLFAVMDMVKAYGMFGELTTNGTLWKEKYIKKAVEMSWDSICVSIDAPDAKTHDWQRRVKGTFKKATQTVKSLRSWRDKLSSEVPCVTLNLVLNKLNYNKLPEMVKLAYELGADAVFVEPMIVYTDLGKELKMSKEEIEKLPHYMQRAKDLAEEYCIATTITCITPTKKFQSELVEKTSEIREVLMEDAKKHSGDDTLSIPCYYPWFYLMIRADGSAIHCGECKNISDNIRNKSLREVWFGPTLEEIRMGFRKGLPSYCRMCRPNVIEDMRELRRAIKRYKRTSYLQKKILELLKENMDLKRQVFRLRTSKCLSKSESELIQKLREQEKELKRFKISLSYRFGKKIGDTRIGKKIKKFFGVYI
ncbi:MAG: radical SAM protein [Candidatus Aenigmarchaeota archaeon]|nr:radical SAM protein [Candidatus Aenigmarchaeota archaeon]